MCGIAGIISRKENEKLQDAIYIIEKKISHRGPNDKGYHFSKNKAFLHLRLSIVDIKSGHQPIYSDNGKIGIIYNGEIYNYKILRTELEKKGYIFKTNSDTEVVLKIFQEYGVESFKKLNGMFAFAIWNELTNEIYLVRDYFGIKPLYIYEDSEKTIFCSELKGILSLANFMNLDLTLEEIGIQDYLHFRYNPSPYTIFKNIKKVEPGTYLIYKDGKWFNYKYFELNYEENNNLKFEDLKNDLDNELKNVVSSQLMGEVPVGVLLSGGLDSSTISYYIKEIGAKLKTFNIGFPEVNEFKYSEEVAKKLGLEHFVIELTIEELLKKYNEINYYLDEPIADPACLPLYELAKELKKHVTVVLSGEGGDEIFGGYPQYQYLYRNNLSFFERYETFIQKSWYFEDTYIFMKNKYLPPKNLRFKKYFDENTLLNGMLAFDLKTWIPDNLMMKADKMLMAHSLEGRFPFLDKRIFELVSKFPEEYKISKESGITKFILKELIKDKLPISIINREKMGFSVPVDKLLEKMKSLVFDNFEEIKKTELKNILELSEIEKLIKNYYKNKESGLKLWTIFSLFYWFNNSLTRYKN